MLPALATPSSAVAASCALPGIMRPQRLEAKDARGRATRHIRAGEVFREAAAFVAADGVIALPGGPGTFAELWEVASLMCGT